LVVWQAVEVPLPDLVAVSKELSEDELFAALEAFLIEDL
jgi:hypothetical protein